MAGPGGEQVASAATAALASLQKRLQSTRSAATETDDALRRMAAETKAENAKRLSRDRSHLAKIIIWTYAIVVGAVVLYTLTADILVIAVKCARSEAAECIGYLGAWTSQTEGLLKIVTTAVLPIVTLMIGFYFGSEKAAGDPKDPNS